MDVDTEIKNLKKEEQQQTQQRATGCCCLPGNANVPSFCGFALLAVGGAWLLSSLGMFTAGLSLIAPLLFIYLGLFWLVRAKQHHA